MLSSASSITCCSSALFFLEPSSIQRLRLFFCLAVFDDVLYTMEAIRRFTQLSIASAVLFYS